MAMDVWNGIGETTVIALQKDDGDSLDKIGNVLRGMGTKAHS